MDHAVAYVKLAKTDFPGQGIKVHWVRVQHDLGIGDITSLPCRRQSDRPRTASATFN